MTRLTDAAEEFDPVPTKEPVLISSLVSSLVLAVLGLIVTFGVDLTVNQTGSIILVASLVIKTVTAIYARSKVTPV